MNILKTHLKHFSLVLMALFIFVACQSQEKEKLPERGVVKPYVDIIYMKNNKQQIGTKIYAILKSHKLNKGFIENAELARYHNLDFLERGYCKNTVLVPSVNIDIDEEIVCGGHKVPAHLKE